MYWKVILVVIELVIVVVVAIIITTLIKAIIAVRLAAIVATVGGEFDHQLQDNIMVIIAVIMAGKPCYLYFLC